MTAHDIGYPILVRPVEPWGDVRSTRIDGTAALASHLEGLAAETIDVSPFAAPRTDSGHYRRFRAFVIDDALYPSHLVFGREWPVHRTARDEIPAGDEWVLAEERQFLADPMAKIGVPACDALRSLGRRLGLDIFGVDFSILEGGEVLLLDLGPRLSFSPGRTDRYPYLKGGYRAIRGAIDELVLARRPGG